jgi:hypothetical protein
LLSDLTVWHEVVRVIEIQLVDLVLRHELVDLDGTLALDRDGFQLFGVQLKVLALADLVPFDDVG